MTDIERRLRELGERVRQEQVPPLLRPEALRATGRRRVGTFATGIGVLAALVLAGTYAMGGLLDVGPDIGPSGPSQASFARLFSVFGEDERAIIEINAGGGTVCVDLTSLKDQGSITRVEIVTDPDSPQTFVPVVPSENAFTPDGGGECVREVDHDMASRMIQHPEDYFLLVESPGDDVRVSALTRASEDGNYAVGREYTIAEGTFQGLNWHYFGYQSNDGLCLELAIGSSSGGGCGETRAIRRLVEVTGAQSMQEPAGPNVSALEGRVSDDVARLEIQIGDDSPEAIEIYDPPDELRLTDRVFVYLAESKKFTGKPDVYLLAYDAAGELLAKVPVKAFDDAVEEKQGVRREDFGALWPEDTAREAEDACGDKDPSSPTRTFRYDPMSAALEFANAKLDWREAIGIRKDFDHEAQSIEVRRSGNDDGQEAEGPAVLVTLVEVTKDCWSVWSVGPAGDEPNGFESITVRGRDVEVAFDAIGADSVSFEMGHGFQTIGYDSEPADGRITALLRYEPDQTGHFLLLFKDENGDVFSATGLPLPAGDFTS